MSRLLITAVLATFCIIGLWQLSRSKSYQLFGKIVSHVPTEEKIVALTLDDGPTKQYTSSILSTLKEHGVYATFFITGQEVEGNLEEAKMIVEHGHDLGNHSYTHPRMVFKSPGFIASEVNATDKLIRAAGHKGEIYFRPPYGKKLVGLPWYLSKNQRISVTWNIAPEKYIDDTSTGEDIANYVLNRLEAGSIILLHVMYSVCEASRDAVPLIINGAKEKGYRFVTLSEMLPMADS